MVRAELPQWVGDCDRGFLCCKCTGFSLGNFDKRGAGAVLAVTPHPDHAENDDRGNDNKTANNKTDDTGCCHVAFSCECCNILRRARCGCRCELA